MTTQQRECGTAAHHHFEETNGKTQKKLSGRMSKITQTFELAHLQAAKATDRLFCGCLSPTQI